MRSTAAPLLLLHVLLGSTMACSFTPASGPEDAPIGTDDGPVGVADALVADADPTLLADAAVDADLTPPDDAAVDARVDAAPPVDAAVDAPVDAAPPVDAAVDAPVDAAPPVDAMVDAAPPTCPAGYVAVPGLSSRYRAVTNQYRRWPGAEADCEDDGAGTHLVVLDSAQELALIDARLSESFWVGVSDRVTEGTWRTVTGVPALLPWNPGEPNDVLGEDCGELTGGGLNDLDCAAFRRYVCECDGNEPAPGAY